MKTIYNESSIVLTQNYIKSSLATNQLDDANEATRSPLSTDQIDTTKGSLAMSLLVTEDKSLLSTLNVKSSLLTSQMGVATYETTEKLPQKYKESLANAKNLKKLIGGEV